MNAGSGVWEEVQAEIDNLCSPYSGRYENNMKYRKKGKSKSMIVCMSVTIKRNTVCGKKKSGDDHHIRFSTPIFSGDTPQSLKGLPTELQDITDHGAFRRKLKTCLKVRLLHRTVISCRRSVRCKRWTV